MSQLPLPLDIIDLQMGAVLVANMLEAWLTAESVSEHSKEIANEHLYHRTAYFSDRDRSFQNYRDQ